MKKIIILFLMLNSSFVFAQIEWAPIGAKWHYDKSEGMMSAGIGYIIIESVKDSIINNKKVRVLLVNHVKPSGDTLKYPNEYTYSESGKVYFWKNKQFHLLYNFNALKDSVWNIFSLDPNPCGKDSIGSVRVDSVRMEQINQKSFKCIYVSPVELSIWSYQKVIEPIGSIGYLFPWPVFCGIADDFPFAGPLRCYEDPNVGLISFTILNKMCNYITTGFQQFYENKIKVYPNPFVNVVNIQFDELPIEKTDIVIENMYGNVIYSQKISDAIETINLKFLYPGIYFVKIMKNNYLIGLTKISKI